MTGDAVPCESLAEGVSHSVWGCLGHRQERRTGPAEGHAIGTSRAASRDGRCHARDKGGPIGLVETIIHGGGQKRVLPTVQSVHEQGCATTIKDGPGPVHPCWQDSTRLCSRKLEVGYRD